MGAPAKIIDSADTQVPVVPALPTLQGAEQWERARAMLRARVGEDVWSSWFTRVQFEDAADGVVTLSAPTKFLKSWITAHYLEQHVLPSFSAVDPAVRRVALIVRTVVIRTTSKELPAARVNGRPSAAVGPGAPEGAPIERPAPTTGGSTLDPRFTFAAFVQGPSNALAYAAAEQIVGAGNDQTPLFNPLYIHSRVGLGKTHLTQAIAWRLCSHPSSRFAKRALYLTVERFMFMFAAALHGRATGDLRQSLHEKLDVLLIDDLQFIKGRELPREFALALDALIEGGRQVVVAADRPPAELEQLDGRVRSRLGGGLTVEIGAHEEALRREILARRVAAARAQHPGFDVPGAVLDFIAQTVTHDGRDLEGALNRLIAHNKLSGRAITMEMAERAVRDLVRPQEPRRVRIEEIQRAVGRHYEISRADLLSARRTINVVRPRQIGMFLSKVLTLRSLPEIGRRWGGRDHTTVLHAVRKIESLAAADAKLAKEIEGIKRELAENT